LLCFLRIGGNQEKIPNSNSEQYNYPIGIAVGHYDNNGFLDFFFLNVGSAPPRWPDVVNSIGAMIIVTTSSGKKSYQPFVIGEGYVRLIL
jgi:hypothetical protein